MKKIIIIFAFLTLSFLIFGCVTPESMDNLSKINNQTPETKENIMNILEGEAIQIMEENDCWWDLSEEGVSIRYEEPYWKMSINRCLGECWIHSKTGEFWKDFDAMCMGANFDPENPDLI